jgi:hypothetical protein
MLAIRQKMLRRLVAAGPIFALVLACASPTLPLPPPLAPTISAGPDADHVKLVATCNVSERNVPILVITEAMGGASVPLDQAVGGALTDPTCGSWDAIVYAHTGNALVITYQLDGQISQPTIVYVH